MNPLWCEYEPISLHVYHNIKILLQDLKNVEDIHNAIKNLEKSTIVDLAINSPKEHFLDIRQIREKRIKKEIKNLCQFFSNVQTPTKVALIFYKFDDTPNKRFYRFIDHSIIFHHIVKSLKKYNTSQEINDNLKSSKFMSEIVEYFFEKLKPKHTAFSIMLEDNIKSKIKKDVEKTVEEMCLHVKDRGLIP